MTKPSFLLLSAVLWLLSARPTLANKQASMARQKLFGLVVGCNRSDNPTQPALRYADDDAVQNAKLLVQLGEPGNVTLMTQLDEQSQRLHPHVFSSPATRRNLDTSMDKLNQKMDLARSLGEVPVLYIFYSGHGDVANDEGYVYLEDSRLYRSDFIQLLKRSRAAFNHVIIDSCRSYYLIFERGPGGTRRSINKPFLMDQEEIPNNTGFLLSTSSAAESHEWEAFQGGVFSHEVRSALRGAADLNADGKISYEEASAFVWTANAEIPNSRYRPSFFTYPPANADAAQAVLLQLPSVADWLHMDGQVRGHCYLEDQNGIRIADFHPGVQQSLSVLLPSRRPLFIRQPGSDEEVVLSEGRDLYLAKLTPRKMRSQPRGAEHIAFCSLFGRPFNHGALDDYRRWMVRSQVSPSTDSNDHWLRKGFGLASAVFTVAGGTLTALARNEHDRASGDDITQPDKRRANERIRRYNTAAVTCYVLAGTALATYLIWTLWPDHAVELQVLPSTDPQVRLTIRY